MEYVVDLLRASFGPSPSAGQPATAASDSGQCSDAGGKHVSAALKASLPLCPEEESAPPRPQPKDSSGQGLGIKRALSLPSAFCNSYGLGEGLLGIQGQRWKADLIVPFIIAPSPSFLYPSVCLISLSAPPLQDTSLAHWPTSSLPPAAWTSSRPPSQRP